MILVDTSVWIDHFRRGRSELSRLLENTEVLIHPFVIGELACGHLRNRREIISLLSALPHTPVTDDAETLALIEEFALFDRGLGWIDVHLLASALMSSSRLWTLDRRLNTVAAALHLTDR